MGCFLGFGSDTLGDDCLCRSFGYGGSIRKEFLDSADSASKYRVLNSFVYRMWRCKILCFYYGGQVSVEGAERIP